MVYAGSSSINKDYTKKEKRRIPEASAKLIGIS